MNLATELEEARAKAEPLAVARSTRTVGYWRAGSTFVFAVEPSPLSDEILVVEGGEATWQSYGPVAGVDRFDDLLEGDPTPFTDAGAEPEDDQAHRR